MIKNKNEILTKRELEILELVAHGKNNYQIAAQLIISIHTVKAHVESIFRKFGVHNKVQAVIYAIYNGYLDIEKY